MKSLEAITRAARAGGIARHAGDDGTRGQCSGCQAPMVTEGRWRAMPVEERQASGLSRHGGHGKCNRCAKAARRGEASGTRASIIPNEEMLEEWVLLRSSGVTDLAEAARRIGTTRAALEQCLYRARRKGDSRGEYHRNDDLGGIASGTTNYGQRRAA